ncbi:MAG: hypothetical protein AAFQ35_03505 [Pseudomonadota bacterium]
MLDEQTVAPSRGVVTARLPAIPAKLEDRLAVHGEPCVELAVTVVGAPDTTDAPGAEAAAAMECAFPIQALQDQLPVSANR